MAGEHEGHRKRIIKKLETGTLLDHELLEIMLFSMLPRRNTNDIAHRLLRKFGSMQEVFSASMEELMKVKGVGENTAANLRCIGIIYRKYFTAKQEGYEGRFDPVNFLSYVNEQYPMVDCEVFDVYLIGKGSEVVKRKRYTEDDGLAAKIGATELSKLLTEERPSGIILVHNHPNGTAKPSKMDDETTNLCQVVCNIHGVIFCDHYIYSPYGVYSYYLSGRLKEIGKSFSLEKLIAEKEEENDGRKEG
jgi:DNA repair protein RadC